APCGQTPARLPPRAPGPPSPRAGRAAPLVADSRPSGASGRAGRGRAAPGRRRYRVLGPVGCSRPPGAARPTPARLRRAPETHSRAAPAARKRERFRARPPSTGGEVACAGAGAPSERPCAGTPVRPSSRRRAGAAEAETAPPSPCAPTSESAAGTQPHDALLGVDHVREVVEEAEPEDAVERRRHRG